MTDSGESQDSIAHGALGAPNYDERCYPQRPCADCFRAIEADWSRQVAHLLTSVRRVDQKYGPYDEFAHWRDAPVSLAEQSLCAHAHPVRNLRGEAIPCPSCGQSGRNEAQSS